MSLKREKDLMSDEEEEELKDKEMTFWGHLTELAIRLRRIVIVLFALTFIFMMVPASFDMNMFYSVMMGDWMKFRPLIADILNKTESDLLPPHTTLISGGFAVPLTVYLEMSILLSVIVSLPYIAYELYMFIAPGLYSREKKFLKTFIFSFSILFILGVIYGYYLIMPLTFKILIYFSDIIGSKPWFTIDDFLSLTILGLAVTGFFFTLPVFLVLAMKFGVVSPETLSKNKRYIYVGLLIITAILTPDPTPVSMILLSIPFIVFYEISLVIGRRVAPKEV